MINISNKILASRLSWNKMLMRRISVYMLMLLTFLLVAQLAFAASSSIQTSTGVDLLTVNLVNQDPDPARAGDIVKIRYQIQNEGNQVFAPRFQIIEDYPFTVVDPNKAQTIEVLSPIQVGENAAFLTFNVKIDKDTRQGSYPIRLKYSYNGIDTTVTYNINVINQEYAQIIYLDKALISPGMETDMNFTVTNVGNSPLQNMIFSWIESTGSILPVYSDNTKYIKYLDVGDSVDLSYKVIADVNAKAGLYQLALNLKYQSLTNSTESIINTKAGIFIGGHTDFDVAFSESTAGQTSLSVANTGNNPASSVSVTIPQQPDYSVSGSNSAIIGNLDKGDYTLVSFQIVSRTASNETGNRTRMQNANAQGIQNFRNFTGNAPGTLQVIISYTDTTGQRVSVQKSVPIQFRTTTTNFSGNASRTTSFIGSTLFWIIIIVVVGGIGFFIYKRVSNPKRR